MVFRRSGSAADFGNFSFAHVFGNWSFTFGHSWAWLVGWLAMHMTQADDLTKEKTSNPSK
jgi:hypothetical protein